MLLSATELRVFALSWVQMTEGVQPTKVQETMEVLTLWREVAWFHGVF